MDLEEYLWRKEMSILEFSKKISATYANLHKIVKKKRSPSMVTALKIVAESEGKVNFIDLISESDCKKLGVPFTKSRNDL